MHLSTPEESPRTGDDKDADNPASEENAATDDLEVEEEAPMADVVIKGEYFKQQEEEEVNYEDDAQIEECEEVVEDGEQVAEVDEDEETTITEVNQLSGNSWEILSTNDTGEAASLMESVLGIQSPKGGHRSSVGSRHPCS